MSKTFFLTLVLLLSATWVVAQQSSQSDQSSGSSQADRSGQSSQGDRSSQTGASSDQTGAAQSSMGANTGNNNNAKQTIQGCLSGSAGNYTLIDKASGTTYQLNGKESKLSAHVGQEVEVTGSAKGSASSASSSSGAETSANSSSSPSGTTSSASTSPSGSNSSSQSFKVGNIRKVSDSCSNK